MAALVGKTRMMQDFFAHWQLQVPRLLLALLTYLLIARLLLEGLFGARSDRTIVRGLCRLTNPVVGAVGAITPRVVPEPMLTLCAIVWVLAARMVLVQLSAALLMRRTMG